MLAITVVVPGQTFFPRKESYLDVRWLFRNICLLLTSAQMEPATRALGHCLL